MRVSPTTSTATPASDNAIVERYSFIRESKIPGVRFVKRFTIHVMNGDEHRGDPPDWRTFSLELCCPRCGYNLRGLPQPRCPECGLTFSWTKLITAAREQSKSPLFEYQWRHKPVRAFIATSCCVLWPWKLWRDTPIELTPRVGALLGFVALWIVLFTLIQVTVGAVYVLWDWWNAGLARAGVAGMLPAATGMLQHLVASAAPRLVTTVLLGASVWAFVQIFHQTMSHAHVRRDQVLRVVVFAWLPVMAWQTATAAILVSAQSFGGGMSWSVVRRVGLSSPWVYGVVFPGGTLADTCVLLPGELVTLLLAVASLSVGLDRYLRLRRGRWIGLVTGATIALGWLTLTFAVYSFGRTSWIRYAVPEAWPGLWSVLRELLRASVRW